MATTMLANLINPQVLADVVDSKLIDYVRFAPLATVDNTLEGRPGDTLTLPSFKYIGAASDVSEASAMIPVSLTTASASVQIKEIGKAVEISDSAILSGYGDPVGEIEKQLLVSIADKMDIDFLTICASISSTMTYTTSASTAAIAPADVGDALELFGEDIDGVKALLCSPKLYGKIRKTSDWLPASEISADKMIRGAVGEIHGCQIIVTNRLKGAAGTGLDENAYIIKPGALRQILKRNSLAEQDRDILRRVNVYTITKHYAAYLYDASKAIKLAVHA